MVRAARILAGSSLVWAMGVSAARTLRPPNDFAEAHWLIDYRFGFIRRGLVGSLLREASWLGLGLQTETAIRTLAYGTFAALCAALLVVAFRVAARTDWDRHVVLVLAVFVSSPFVVTNAHLMGYLDHLVFVLAVGAVGLTLAGRAWWGAALAAASVFIHESTLVFTLPLLAFAVSMQPATASDGARRDRAWWPLVLPLAAFAVVAVSESLVTDRLALLQLLQLRLHRYPFIQGDMHLFVPEWLTTTFAENFAAQRHRFFDRITDGPVVITVLPAVQALLFGALAWVSSTDRRRAGWWLLAVACAPLVLHLSAWDTARIWTYTIGTALCGVWIVVERFPGSRSPALAIAPVVALPAIYMNLAGRVPLLDNAVERFTGPQLLALYAPAALAYLVFRVLDSRSRGGAHA